MMVQFLPSGAGAVRPFARPRATLALGGTSDTAIDTPLGSSVFDAYLVVLEGKGNAAAHRPFARRRTTLALGGTSDTAIDTPLGSSVFGAYLAVLEGKGNVAAHEPADRRGAIPSTLRHN